MTETEYFDLMKKKTQILTEAQTLIAIGNIEEGRKLYINASEKEFEIAIKFPQYRFIHLLSCFWCAYKGNNLEICEKSLNLLKTINKTNLNDTQIEEIIKIKKQMKRKYKNV
jgi:hypothetical protein